MIDEKFIKGAQKLIKILKKLEYAEDLDESTIEALNLDIDFWEIISWSRYCIEETLKEILWKNTSKSTINEIKDKVSDLKASQPENAELFDDVIRAMEAMQWTAKNSAKVHKKEKQDLWKKAVKTVYKDAVASHDLVMGETKYIDLKILRDIRDKHLGETIK